MNKRENFLQIAKSAKYFLQLIILLFTITSARAQLPALRISYDKQAILIGEHFHCKIDASFPIHSFKVQFPALPDSFNHFEVVKKGEVQTAEKNGILNCSQEFTFTSFDSGLNNFPSLPVIFKPANQNSAIRLLTDSFLINVSYSPLDSVKTFHDIKSIIEVKDEWPLWMWIALGLSIILLIILLYSLYKNRKRKKPAVVFASKLSPLEEARQSLKELEKQQVLSKGEVKLFHTRLAEIFKRYISRKTNTSLLHFTTDEVLIHMETLNLNKDIISAAASTLRMGDAVKFAKFLPFREMSNQAYADTAALIEKIEQVTINRKSDI
jgi:hypothetical protein